MDADAVKKTTQQDGFRDLVSDARDNLATEQYSENYEADAAGAHAPLAGVPGRQNEAGIGLPVGGKSLPELSARFEQTAYGTMVAAPSSAQLAGSVTGERTNVGKIPGAAAPQKGVDLMGAFSSGLDTGSLQLRGQINSGFAGLNADQSIKDFSDATNIAKGLAAHGPKSGQSHSGMISQAGESLTDLAQILGAQSKAEARRSPALVASGNAEAERLNAIGKRLGEGALSPVQAGRNRLNLDLELNGDVERNPRAGSAASASAGQSQIMTSALAGGVSVVLPPAISPSALLASSPAVAPDEALAGTLQAAVSRQSAEAADAMQSQVQKFIALRSSTPGHVSLQLHPRELGRLDMDFRQEGGELQVQITARETQTREMLESVLPRLKASLLELGIQVGKFDIEGGDQQAKHDASERALADASAQQPDEGDEASETSPEEVADGFDPAQPGRLHITV